MRERRFRRLALAITLVAFVVVVLGAWVRLTGAGLGCPDWPGCYGRMVIGPAGTGLGAAIEGTAVDGGKAWREMVHRYFAGALGLAILALAVVAARNRRGSGAGGPIALPVALVVLVAFQAALGAWTVTLRLQPAVVVAHLLGGMAILGLLWRLYLGPPAPAGGSRPGWVRPAVAIGVGVLAVQIALGGWTSANYAALACPDFPTCHRSWWPDGDYVAGFRLWQEPGSGSGSGSREGCSPSRRGSPSTWCIASGRSSPSSTSGAFARRRCGGAGRTGASPRRPCPSSGCSSSRRPSAFRTCGSDCRSGWPSPIMRRQRFCSLR